MTKTKTKPRIKKTKIKTNLMMNWSACIDFFKKVVYSCNGALRLWNISFKKMMKHGKEAPIRWILNNTKAFLTLA